MTGLAEVLAAHEQVGELGECRCKWEPSGWSEEWVRQHHAHVAAAVTAWLAERLGESDIVDTVALNRWPTFDEASVETQGVMRDYVRSDLAAVVGALAGES